MKELFKTLETIQQLDKITSGCRKIVDQIDNQPDNINVLRCIKVLMKSQATLAEVIAAVLRENTDQPGSSVPDFGDMINTLFKKGEKHA
jgi:hypothetical protein